MVISTIPVGLELFLSRWDETVDQIHKSLSIEPNTRWWRGFYDWGYFFIFQWRVLMYVMIIEVTGRGC